MKNPTQIACLFVAVAAISSTAFAGADNCSTYWPKVPYSCVLVNDMNYPAERADFSAFETGAVKAAAGKSATTHYTLRSVSRETAREMRSAAAGIAN